MELRQQGPALALHLADPEPDRPALAPSILDRVARALAEAPSPLTREDLRRACGVRMSSLGEALATLTAEGRVLRSSDGYQLVGR